MSPATPVSPGPRRRSVFTARLTNSAGAGEPPRVLDDLRQAIRNGDEPPGTLIPIDAVARFFGVSQIPVREALRELLGEGLVEHVPHVGYSVAKLSFAEFRELYVRQALEASVLRQAVLHATADDDADAGRAHAALLTAIEAGDERGYHAASRAFHRALIAPARTERLVRMYEAAWNMTEPVRPMARIPSAERRQLHADHEQMLAAFVARDADALTAESAEHYRHLLAALEELREDPEVFRISLP